MCNYWAARLEPITIIMLTAGKIFVALYATCHLLLLDLTVFACPHFNLNSSASALERPGCGLSRYNNSARILGGQPALPGQFPWQAKLTVGGKLVLCGGSIIKPQYILTAAHCFRSCGINVRRVNNLETMSVRLGAHEYGLKDHGEEFGVAKVVVHEGYCEGRLFVADIALIKLSRRIPFKLTADGYGSMDAICLPSRGTQYKAGEMFTVAGWGVDKSRLPPKQLNHVQIAHVDDGQCERKFLSMDDNYLNFEPGRDICAGGKLDEGHCIGDSGGPLMRPLGATHRHELVGVVSRDYHCAKEDLPGIYTRVEAYLDWIEENSAD